MLKSVKLSFGLIAYNIKYMNKNKKIILIVVLTLIFFTIFYFFVDALINKKINKIKEESKTQFIPEVVDSASVNSSISSTTQLSDQELKALTPAAREEVLNNIINTPVSIEKVTGITSDQKDTRALISGGIIVGTATGTNIIKSADNIGANNGTSTSPAIVGGSSGDLQAEIDAIRQKNNQ